MKQRLIVFDTTLRDGVQSPGAWTRLVLAPPRKQTAIGCRGYPCGAKRGKDRKGGRAEAAKGAACTLAWCAGPVGRVVV